MAVRDMAPLVVGDAVVLPRSSDVEVEAVKLTAGWESMDRLVDAVQLAGRDVDHQVFVFGPTRERPYGSAQPVATWKHGPVLVIVDGPELPFDANGGVVVP